MHTYLHCLDCSRNSTMEVNETAQNCPSAEHRAFLFVYLLGVTFLNVLLLHFIRYKTVQNMMTYKIVLYATTIIDFTSAWMQCAIGIRISLQVVFHSNKTYYTELERHASVQPGWLFACSDRGFGLFCWRSSPFLSCTWNVYGCFFASIWAGTVYLPIFWSLLVKF